MVEEILGLPAGWTVLESAVSVNHPRDGYVLCERTQHRNNGHNFVTWYTNRVEGGCSAGHYHETFEKARYDFIGRKGTLR